MNTDAHNATPHTDIETADTMRGQTAGRTRRRNICIGVSVAAIVALGGGFFGAGGVLLVEATTESIQFDPNVASLRWRITRASIEREGDTVQTLSGTLTPLPGSTVVMSRIVSDTLEIRFEEAPKTIQSDSAKLFEFRSLTDDRSITSDASTVFKIPLQNTKFLATLSGTVRVGSAPIGSVTTPDFGVLRSGTATMRYNFWGFAYVGSSLVLHLGDYMTLGSSFGLLQADERPAINFAISQETDRLEVHRPLASASALVLKSSWFDKISKYPPVAAMYAILIALLFWSGKDGLMRFYNRRKRS